MTGSTLSPSLSSSLRPSGQNAVVDVNVAAGQAAWASEPENSPSVPAVASSSERSHRGADFASARVVAHAAGSAVAACRPAVRLPLSQCLGAVLAEDLVAGAPLPPFDTCAMDGWLVRGSPPWRVVASTLAGHPAPAGFRLGSGQACVVGTGSAVVEGATGLVRAEHGHQDGCWLQPISSSAHNLRDIRPHGLEASAGELLAPAWTALNPPLLGLVAASGRDELLVRRRPRVDCLVLGDELLHRGPPRHGRIRDALGVQLPGWLEPAGEVVGVRPVADTVADVARALRESTADLLVTTGGSARGAADQLRPALAALGGEFLVDSVDVRPGHPMLMAALPGDRLVIGLPGNPLAALAGIVTLAWPTLAGLAGGPLPALQSAVAEVPFSGASRGVALVPVTAGRAGATQSLRPTGHDGPAMLRGIACARALAVVPAGGVAACAILNVIPLPW